MKAGGIRRDLVIKVGTLAVVLYVTVLVMVVIFDENLGFWEKRTRCWFDGDQVDSVCQLRHSLQAMNRLLPVNEAMEKFRADFKARGLRSEGGIQFRPNLPRGPLHRCERVPFQVMEHRLNKTASATTDHYHSLPNITIDYVRLPNFEACHTSGHGNTVIVVLVKTAISHTERRMAIRDRIRTVKTDSNVKLVLCFLVGLENGNASRDLAVEMDTYVDFVQFNFQDTYANLIYKTISGLGWLQEHCPAGTHVAYIDDDVYMKFDELANFATTCLGKADDPSIGCTGQSEQGGEIHRATSEQIGSGACGWCSKWGVFPEEFLNKTDWPPFCHGQFYIMRANFASRLHEAARRLPYFRLEDVFLTGLVLQTLGSSDESNEGKRPERIRIAMGARGYEFIPSPPLDDGLWISVSHG